MTSPEDFVDPAPELLREQTMSRSVSHTRGRDLNKQITWRGLDPDSELERRIDEVLVGLPGGGAGVTLAKFALEVRETSEHAVALVLALADGDEPLVRHAEAKDWPAAFLELDRKLARAFEG
jgi:hypothetical protein